MVESNQHNNPMHGREITGNNFVKGTNMIIPKFEERIKAKPKGTSFIDELHLMASMKDSFYSILVM